MSDQNTYTNLCNFRSAINAFRRDLYQGCLTRKISLNSIEDRLWDIWPEGRDVDLVRAKIQEVRNSIDAVWNECDSNVTQSAWRVFDKWEQVYNQEEQEREEQKKREQEEMLRNKPAATDSAW